MVVDFKAGMIMVFVIMIFVIVMACVIMFFVLMSVCVWYDDDGTETLFFSTKSPTLPATLDTVPAAGA